MRKTIVFGALLAAWLPALAFCADTQTPDRVANRFFATLLQGRESEAIEFFMGTNPVLKGNAEQIKYMKDQLASATRRYGRPFAVESVSVEDITPSLQRRVYLTKHLNHPLVWEMYFYKPNNEWMPDQIMFFDQYQVIGRKR